MTPYRVQPQPEAVLVQIGDIGVTQHWIITPNGPEPLAGSQWTVQDRTVVTHATPTWAVVLAVLGFFFFLGLLFLLVKEDRVGGSVEVSVRSGSLWHLTQIPSSSSERYQVHPKVSYAQQLTRQAAMAARG